MTEAEWEAIAEQLAREVLNLTRWTDEWEAEWWGAYKYDAHIRVDSWQPHLDIGQAMMLKDKIVRQRWCFDLSNRPDSISVVYFWEYLRPCVGIQGANETDAKAICLAAEAWADAQEKGGCR